MQWGGLSMAMGAFLAGVLLSESTFRHQLEADIEPFRGILLGLFFLSVGMSLDLRVVVAASGGWSRRGSPRSWRSRRSASTAWRALFRADHRESLQRAALFAQGGEFAFVLYAAALAAGVFDARAAAVLSAIVDPVDGAHADRGAAARSPACRRRRRRSTASTSRRA